MQIITLLSEPYPFEDDKIRLLKSSVLIGSFVALFLLVFRPFGLAAISEISFGSRIVIFAGYGLITFVISYSYDHLTRMVFPRFFNDRSWTLGKQLLSLLVLVFLIGLGNLFYSHFLGFTGISGTSMLYFQMYTLLIGIFPVTAITLFARMKHLRDNLEDARSLNEKLGVIKGQVSDHAIVLKFISENEKESLELSHDQFLYAESADNYTEIVFLENKILRRFLIRSSLRRILMTVDDADLFQCHRSFIVNLKQIRKVTGNTQGCRLELAGTTDQIPVSRRNVTELKQLLDESRNASG
jgi:DNA-binding LytR/AlgR family response regulator